jgi:hypothetical protein
MKTDAPCSNWRDCCERCLPERLCYIAKDNPVSALDVFVEELDLEVAGFKGMRPKRRAGQATIRPTLLKIYIYGSLNRIYSNRADDWSGKLSAMWN